MVQYFVRFFNSVWFYWPTSVQYKKKLKLSIMSVSWVILRPKYIFFQVVVEVVVEVVPYLGWRPLYVYNAHHHTGSCYRYRYSFSNTLNYTLYTTTAVALFLPQLSLLFHHYLHIWIRIHNYLVSGNKSVYQLKVTEHWMMKKCQYFCTNFVFNLLE